MRRSRSSPPKGSSGSRPEPNTPPKRANQAEIIDDGVDPLALGRQPKLDFLQEGHPTGGAAAKVRPGESLTGGGAERTEDVALAAPAIINLLPGSSGGRTARLHQGLAGEGLGALRPHLIKADDYAACRRRGVERRDPPLFSANSGSTRSPNHVSCRRQRKAFSEQDLVDPAALDRDPFVLAQVGRQPVQRP